MIDIGMRRRSPRTSSPVRRPRSSASFSLAFRTFSLSLLLSLRLASSSFRSASSSVLRCRSALVVRSVT